MRNSKSFKSQKLLFIAKLFLGALPFFVFYCFARFSADGYMDGGWAMCKQVKSYINQTGVYNDFLIIGDSTAKFNLNALALSSVDCSVQNVAISATSLIENYYTLKTYLGNDNKVNTIFLILAPFHFHSTESFATQTEYFHILPFWDAVEVYKKAVDCKNDANIQREFFVTNPPIVKLLQASMFYPVKYLPAMNNSRFINRYKSNKDSELSLEKYRGTILRGAQISPQKTYSGVTEFSIDKQQNFYFRKILQLCNDYNIHVILEQSPMPELNKTEITESFERDFFSCLNEFKTEFPELICPQKFTYYDDKYFTDGSHMNNNGNAAWTQYIKETYIDPYIQNKKLLEETK